MLNSKYEDNEVALQWKKNFFSIKRSSTVRFPETALYVTDDHYQYGDETYMSKKDYNSWKT